jgi:hypothetical protein
MKIQKSREIIIEYERLQIIRKRARTNLEFCNKCQTNADFVSLSDAGVLFGTSSENLFRFVQINNSHYKTEADGKIFICLISLLDFIKSTTNITKLELKGE